MTKAAASKAPSTAEDTQTDSPEAEEEDQEEAEPEDGDREELTLHAQDGQ